MEHSIFRCYVKDPLSKRFTISAGPRQVISRNTKMPPSCTMPLSDTTRKEGTCSIPQNFLTPNFQISRSDFFVAAYARCAHIGYRLGLAFPPAVWPALSQRLQVQCWKIRRSVGSSSYKTLASLILLPATIRLSSFTCQMHLIRRVEPGRCG